MDEGTTVLLTTQYLEEADQLAERIAVIDQGAVIAEGTSRELKASVGSNVLHLQLADPAQREQAQLMLADHLNSLVHLEADPASLTVQLSDSAQATQALAALPQTGIELHSFSMGQPSLDEVFLSLTGHTVSPQSDPEEAPQ